MLKIQTLTIYQKNLLEVDLRKTFCRSNYFEQLTRVVLLVGGSSKNYSFVKSMTQETTIAHNYRGADLL